MKEMSALLIFLIVACSTTTYGGPSSLALRPSPLAEQSDCEAARLATPSTASAQTRVPKRFKILLIQGANLSYLGRREPELYGTTSAAELDSMLRAYAGKRGYDLETFYTHIEGEAIARLYRAADEHTNISTVS
jgi:hypothetical protein